MMTKKHYQAIANIVKNWDETSGKNNLIDSLVDYMRYDNSAFNAEKFREACAAPCVARKTKRNYPDYPVLKGVEVEKFKVKRRPTR